MAAPHMQATGWSTTAERWLRLAVLALGLAALCALVLVISRTPLVPSAIAEAVFPRALILHVNLSVLVWLLCFCALAWQLEQPMTSPTLPGVAAIGVLLMLFAALFVGGMPVLGDYLPLLLNGTFVTGLLLFMTASALAALGRFRSHPGARWHDDPVRLAGWFGSAAVLLAFLTFAGGWLAGDAGLDVASRSMSAGWGFGHVLQFAYALLATQLWLVLVKLSMPGNMRWPRWLPLVLVAGVLPAIVGPWLNLLPEQGAMPRDEAFRWLMMTGGWMPGVPVAIWALYKALNSRLREGDSAIFTGLILSTLLYLGGILFGLMIRADNLMVPAHYHGTVGGITLACMCGSWVLLERWGFVVPTHSHRVLQAKLYGGGLLMLILGLAVLGLGGGERKTPFVAGMEALPLEVIALVCVAVGGFAAVSGALLFVVYVTRSLVVSRRSARVGLSDAFGTEPRS